MIGQEVRVSVAEGVARGNWRLNLRALGRGQVAVGEMIRAGGFVEGGEWVLSRDGVLTLRTPDGVWIGGSAVPREVARRILAKTQLGSAMVCIVCPRHAQEVREAMSKLSAGQGMIVVQPDDAALRIMLGCEDFSPQMIAGRLWVAGGSQWADQLRNLLEGNEGLPVPSQFIRTAEADETTRIVSEAERILRSENDRRAARVREIFSAAHSRDTGEVVVVAPSRFRLMEDVGHVLGKIARSQGWAILDPDEVTTASPVALARAACGASALIVSNVGRADLPASLPRQIRLITWVTSGRIPRCDSPADALILADPRWKGLATSGGWTDNQIRIGGWARNAEPGNPASTAQSTLLAVVGDVGSLAAPEFEMSSHRVLWDCIAGEVLADPWRVGDDAGAFLDAWLKKTGVSADGLDRRAFLERCIGGAYARGVVRTLSAAGISLEIWGHGWDGPEEKLLRGQIDSRGGLRAAMERAAGVVDVWPAGWGRACAGWGKPVVGGKSKRELLEIAHRTLSTGQGLPAIPGLTPELLRDLLNVTSQDRRAA